MTKPAILLGFGGHGHVVADLLTVTGFQIEGYTGPQAESARFSDDPAYLGSDDLVLARDPETIVLANGLGSIGNAGLRRKVFLQFLDQGYAFPVLQHDSATVAADARVEAGAQIMAGAVVQSGVRIGQNALINTSASIDHDCTIGDHVHVAPGAVLSGNVTLEEGAHVGTGATIIQNIHVGAGAIVGAGAVVIADVPAHTTVVGNPARALG